MGATVQPQRNTKKFCDYIFEEQAVADAVAAVVVVCHLLFVKEIFSGPAEKVFLVQAKNVLTAQPAHLHACQSARLPAYLPTKRFLSNSFTQSLWQSC